MVLMSPRKAAPTFISMPSRVLSLARSRAGSTSSGSDSGPCTPSPRTPLPYSYEYVNGALSIGGPSLEGGGASGSGGKRQREDDGDAEGDAQSDISGEWLQDELDMVRAAVNHPLRPLSSPYPPGEMPPAHILDELTSQIVNHHPSSSPATRRRPGKTQTKPFFDLHGDDSDTTPTQSLPGDKSRWAHSWEATRKRVYSASVAATRAARGLDQEKLPMEERVMRPSLRRMDSMDFLDQVSVSDAEADEEEAAGPSSRLGRAARLSTSLQNSTKAAPPLMRAASLGSANLGLTMDEPSSLSAGPSGPSLTITPASPVSAPPASSMGTGSIRRSTRQPRPSLLQRGRSFTASDLGSEDAVPDSPDSPTLKARTAPTSPRVVLASLAPLSALAAEPAAVLDARSAPRSRTRADGALSLDLPLTMLRGPAPARALAPGPSLLPAVESRPATRSNTPKARATEWSDSDDEVRPRRASKKLRPKRAMGSPAGGGIGRSGSMMGLNKGFGGLASGGLQSPFEERDALI